MRMLQPRLPTCLRRAFHSSTRAYGAAPSSVARLLQASPVEADNVTVNGFIRSIRNQKQRSFASIGDGSSLEPLQAVIPPQLARSLSTGTAVRLTGSWQPSPKGTAQSHELHVASVDVLGASDAATFPLQKKYHTPEFLRTMPHLRPRSAFNSTLLRFRSQAIAELTSFFAERDFTQTHPPITTSSDCEGAGEVFSLETAESGPVTEESDGSFFRSPKYLTVSSQLHLEALAHAVGRVWTLSPTFRAERSETARHLSEFYMLEAEVNFVEEMEDVMGLVEKMLQHVTRQLYDAQVGRELLHGKRSGEQGDAPSVLPDELERRWKGMMSEAWPRITYSEAIAWLQKQNHNFELPVQWESGLQAEHEKFLASTVGRGRPVFVTKYPKAIKPFYMLESPGEGPHPTVECFDLIVPEVCEIAGGSMREHRLPQLLSSMQAHGLVPPTPSSGEEPDLGSLKWYVDLRRWGSVPHGGFGLGFDRLLGYLAGVANIKDVVTFPRWVGRCEC